MAGSHVLGTRMAPGYEPPSGSMSPGAQMLNRAGVAMIPPPLAVRPELTADDVAWLNDQMALVDRPPVRYARELPRPPTWGVVQA